MPHFRQILDDGALYRFDGSYGVLLQSRGLPAGASPELWGLANPGVVSAIHADYLAAGAQILTTNTFGGTAPKLGASIEVAGLNREMALLARSIAGNKAFVAGSVGPTGLFVRPLGPLSLREMVALFAAQIRGLVEGGVDAVKLETMFDLAELKAAVLAAREVCDLPVIACMTFETAAATLTGTPPLTFLDTCQNLGVEVVGVNCSAGPDEIARTVAAMLPRLATPLHVQPNAGLPELVGGRTVFRLGPAEFAQKSLALAEAGAKFLGGCCGTTPEHIAALSSALAGRSWQRPEPGAPAQVVLTSRAGSVEIGWDWPAVIIGERVNPTGKARLTEELQAGEFGEALRLAEEQLTLGARVLDVNVGAPMVKEADVLPRLTAELTARCPLPLCLDTSDVEAVEAALWECPGSPLVNSISGEPGRLERLGPLCKKFGAPFILLPLKGRKLPVTAGERLAIIEELLAQADALGIPRRLILVDALVLTVSSKPKAAAACLDVIRACRERFGLATTMGLSNVSFGLPARELLNATFLAMVLASGGASFIANPGSARLREALGAAEVLLGRDPQAGRFIAAFADWKPGAGGGFGGGPGPARAVAATPREAVVAGAKDAVVLLVETALAEGRSAAAIMDEELIPGIMEVGEKYERKEYFLPQLLQSAETMQRAFERLKPLLEARSDVARPKIVMATVEGDIHDIGKNIVCLMLKNHGFEVVDLGKDVPAERIVAAAREHGAPLIGLSALMTTTMVRMEEVVKLARKEGLPARIMVGGAVLTEAYARAIGADGYSPDAVAAVKLAKALLSCPA